MVKTGRPEHTQPDPMRQIDEQLEWRAYTDYMAARGRVLLVRVVTGYSDADDSVDVVCDPPARVRVAQTPDDDLRHWVDNWLDPYWDVDLIEPHPALKGIRSMWVFAPSYCTDGRTEPSSDWTFEPTASEKITAGLRRLWEVARG